MNYPSKLVEDAVEAFIAPCRCRGTLKYIHEECLNRWLISKGLTEPTCELCSSQMRMRVDVRKRCALRSAYKSMPFKCFLITLFIVTLGLISAVLLELSLQLQDQATSPCELVSTAIILGGYILTSAMLVYLIVRLFKTTCIHTVVVNWQILEA